MKEAVFQTQNLRKVKECDNMEHASEVLSIIEAGLEENEVKVRNYAKLLMEKLPDDDHMKTSIRNRLDGSYKNKPKLEAI
jgi:hypothetical protein